MLLGLVTAKKCHPSLPEFDRHSQAAQAEPTSQKNRFDLKLAMIVGSSLLMQRDDPSNSKSVLFWLD